MIYNITSKPDVNHKPADSHQSPLGVSSLPVENGIYYLFWYKTVVY